MSYEEVSKSNGKEMKEMSRYLLGVLTQTLRCGRPAQRPIFNHAIEWPQALLEFYIYVRYQSHDDATLSYMEDAVRRFYTLNNIFLLRWAGKKVKAKANALRMELVTKWNVDEETTADTRMLSKKWCEINPWPDHISHKIDVSQQLGADFNIPKIYLMSDQVAQIHRYGAFQQYSVARHQQAHKPNLKDGWNASNHNFNYLPQVITFQLHILCFEIKEVKLQALAQRCENSAAAFKVLPSGADLAAPLSLQSYAKSEFRGPQNCCGWKHPDAMMNNFRALLDNTQNATHRMVVYSGTKEFIKHKSHNKMYILDEQLHAMELCNYPGIKVQVEGLDGECLSQMCQCTGIQTWCEGDWQNDWVWVKQRPGRCYGTLNGCLLWQMQRLFNIKILKEDRAFVEYWLSLALTTMPPNSGNLDPVSKFVQVRKALAAIALLVFSVGNIVRCTHTIPEIATHSDTRDWRNERWIVNCHIDLVTWNDVYNYYREDCILHTGRGNARSDFRDVTHRIAIPMQVRNQ